MAAKKSTPAFDFVVEQLKKNTQASYGEISAAAQKKNLKIYPIMYGRAKAMLGLVPSAPRGTGKAARKTAGAKKAAAKVAAKVAAKPAPAPKGRRPGRPPATPPTAVSGLDTVISHVRATEAEREKFRRALDRIRAILDELA